MLRTRSKILELTYFSSSKHLDNSKAAVLWLQDILTYRISQRTRINPCFSNQDVVMQVSLLVLFHTPRKHVSAERRITFAPPHCVFCRYAPTTHACRAQHKCSSMRCLTSQKFNLASQTKPRCQQRGQFDWWKALAVLQRLAPGNRADPTSWNWRQTLRVVAWPYHHTTWYFSPGKAV